MTYPDNPVIGKEASYTSLKEYRCKSHITKLYTRPMSRAFPSQALALQSGLCDAIWVLLFEGRPSAASPFMQLKHMLLKFHMKFAFNRFGTLFFHRFHFCCSPSCFRVFPNTVVEFTHSDDQFTTWRRRRGVRRAESWGARIILRTQRITTWAASNRRASPPTGTSPNRDFISARAGGGISNFGVFLFLRLPEKEGKPHQTQGNFPSQSE